MFLSPPDALPCSLYVHLPWCVRKCPYCDFNSYEGTALPEDRYLEALLRDLDEECRFAPIPALTSVFLGGGTPSLFSGAAIQRLLTAIRARLPLAPSCEITLEANPGAADAERFSAYVEAGVNRLSIGAQSFCDTHLRALGRVHTARDIGLALAAVRAVGCTNLNIDLMYGLPGQTPAGLARDLAHAKAAAPEQLSLYQLTLEPGTPFAHHPPTLPDDAVLEEMEQVLQGVAADGYHRYEVSAYARPGAQSVHNLNYWHYGDYVGIGAGAHGKRTRADGVWRSQKPGQPERYMTTAGTADRKPVAPGELPFEFMLNALRLVDGFSLPLFEARTGLPRTALDPGLTRAHALGLLEQTRDWVQPTAAGQRFLNDLQALFLPAGTRVPG